MEHRLAGEEGADAHAVEAPDQRSLLVIGLERVRPPEQVQLPVGGDERRGDPRSGTTRIGTLQDDVAERRVPADVVPPHAAPQ